jgi:hypothetical protein
LRAGTCSPPAAEEAELAVALLSLLEPAVTSGALVGAGGVGAEAAADTGADAVSSLCAELRRNAITSATPATKESAMTRAGQ